jgi:hypothetical protein
MKTCLRRSLFAISASALFIAPFAFAASGPSANDWVANTASLQISVDKNTGVIDHLIDSVSHEDYCNQSLSNATADQDGNRGLPFTIGPRIGGLVLYDELLQKTFSDLKNTGTVSNLQASAKGLSFDKQYPGADFIVHEEFVVEPNDVRWNVRVHKTAGADRTVRVIYDIPMPLGGEAWAPIAEAPFTVKPWLPFSIDYGQSTAGAIGEGEWRTTVPLMVFYSKRKDRALAIASPLEVPAVRIRFLNNTSATADFYWNSRRYPASERPYFQVSNEDLGMRANRDLQTSLLLTAQPANWRPALGWFYAKYKAYFDPDPAFDKWDGVYGEADSFMNPKLTTAQVKAAYAELYKRGVRWEEYHSPYVHYGQMIPPPNVKSWVDISDPNDMQPLLTRAKIEEHCKIARDAGVGTFLYYNTTESEYWYAQENFPESIAKNEMDQPIAAWRGNEYPSKRACWLMNSDPSTGFGKSMIDEARQMVQSYPDMAGFFWDVYGRSYMFDFAHDDGITMVDNKPAYYPEFMYRRLLGGYIGPLLHSRGMTITANKPVTVASTKGVDGIMTMEDAPDEVSPGWITTQSYLGLNRHVMILDDNGANAEMLYLHCLRYGAFNSVLSDRGINRKTGKQGPLSSQALAANREMEKKYQPFVNMFAGKKWIFYPHALDLPQDTYGNIFRLKNGDVMITMVSAWRALHHASGYDTDLQVTARLADASAVKSVEVDSVDLGEKSVSRPDRNGNTLTITVPKHGKATVILLHMKG